MVDSPYGTSTVLLNDGEGSTRLLQEQPAAKPEAIVHDESMLRLKVERQGEVTVMPPDGARRLTAALASWGKVL